MTDLTEDALARIEAGRIAMEQLRKVSEDRRIALETAEHQMKLMNLEIASMGKQVLQAEQGREIALGVRNEAVEAYVAIKTKLEAVQKITAEFEPPPVRKQNGAETGLAAVEGAVRPKQEASREK